MVIIARKIGVLKKACSIESESSLVNGTRVTNLNFKDEVKMDLNILLNPGLHCNNFGSFETNIE